MTNGEKHIEKLLSWYKEAVTEDGVCYLTCDDKNTLAYAIKCCKHFEDIKKDIDIWMLRNNPSRSEIPTGSVDCISREQVLVAIRNLYPSMPRVDFNGSLRKWVDKYKPYIECEDAIKELSPVTPQEPRWIPVSERLPEEDGEYLVTTINGDVDIYVFHTWGANPHKVIAWMPLPEPYEPQESEG